jgi:hypothetical protein
MITVKELRIDYVYRKKKLQTSVITKLVVIGCNNDDIRFGTLGFYWRRGEIISKYEGYI